MILKKNKLRKREREGFRSETETSSYSNLNFIILLSEYSRERKIYELSVLREIDRDRRKIEGGFVE